MLSVILTLEEVQALIKAGTHLEKISKDYEKLLARHNALYGLYTEMLMTLADIQNQL